jgi:hypothetical protein
MDMDMEPYCVHPTVSASHPYGLLIDSAIKRFCGDGDKLKLWEPRKPR